VNYALTTSFKFFYNNNKPFITLWGRVLLQSIKKYIYFVLSQTQLSWILSYHIFSLFNFFWSDICSVSIIWYFIFPLFFVIWYLCSISVNLVFAFYFCNFLWSDCITSKRYFFSFCDICSVSAIWNFVLCFFCVMVFLYLLIIATERDDSL